MLGFFLKEELNNQSKNQRFICQTVMSQCTDTPWSALLHHCSKVTNDNQPWEVWKKDFHGVSSYSQYFWVICPTEVVFQPQSTNLIATTQGDKSLSTLLEWWELNRVHEYFCLTIQIKQATVWGQVSYLSLINNQNTVYKTEWCGTDSLNGHINKTVCKKFKLWISLHG